MDIIEINRRHVFTLQEAQELLPVVFKITKNYSMKVDTLIDRIDSLGGTNENLVLSLENQVNEMIHDWQNKMQKLGAMPKGLWIADFDSGDGFFCWKFPERSIEFWHRYSDGFSKRQHVSERELAAPTVERLRRRIFPLGNSSTSKSNSIHPSGDENSPVL